MSWSGNARAERAFQGTARPLTPAKGRVFPSWRLSQMFGDGAELRARTDHQGTVTMAFSHYAPAILSADDGDRAADVTAPLHPRTPPLILRASVPEPRD